MLEDGSVDRFLAAYCIRCTGDIGESALIKLLRAKFTKAQVKAACASALSTRMPVYKRYLKCAILDIDTPEMLKFQTGQLS